MRNLIVTLLLFGLIPVSLVRPLVAVSVYMVISLMSPHRLTWGFAYDFPWAWIYAVVMTIAVFHKHGDQLLPALRTYRLPLLFFAWTCVTTVFAFTFQLASDRLITFLKIQYGVLLMLMCIQGAQHVKIFLGVIALSVGLLSIKTALFMLATGGQYRLQGPSGTAISDNNHYAAALVMMIPLAFWLATVAKHRWAKLVFFATVFGCALSALGSYSRGGFLALACMAAVAFFRSRRKVLLTVVLVPTLAFGLLFMPDKFWERIYTIEQYQTDESAMGRIVAWKANINIANSNFTGGGFDSYTSPENYLQFAPAGAMPRAAHSIFFQVLGDHGWVGLLLFLAILVSLLWSLQRDIRRSAAVKDIARYDLARAMQVVLIAYSVAGAFLSLAYWDGFYYLMAIVLFLKFHPEVSFKAVASADPTPAPVPRRFVRTPEPAR